MTQPTRPLPNYASDTAPIHGVLAEFDDVTALTLACEKVRDQGYTKWDAHSPFPVHGLDAAMGVKTTRLPWFVLVCGLFGLSFGLWLQGWTMGVSYKFIISGKPLFSFPAFVPVTFELTVLCSAFAIFFGTLARNGLPELFHPLNLAPQFRRVTDDRFFIYIEAKDPKFDEGKVTALLQAQSPLSLQTIRYEAYGPHARFPAGTTGMVYILAVLSLLPFALFARARERTSPLPRMHPNPPAPIVDDMDRQYKFGPQTTNWFFADGRAMRNWPQGAVAQEDVVEETPYTSGKLAKAEPAPHAPEVRAPAHAAGHRGHGKGSERPPTPPVTPSVAEQPGFVTDFPAEVVLNETTMARGKQRFDIYCSTCHGLTGHGDGIVARHADALQEGTWVTPSSLHDARVRGLAVGDLYNTVTHGVRNMPGYGHLIGLEDRWAIVAYIKALQRSQHAKADDVDADKRKTLQ